MHVVMRILSSLALITLLIGGAVSTVHATGTNTLHEISDGVRAVGETFRSTEVTGNIGWMAIAFIGLGLLAGHYAGGFVGAFVGLIGLGFLFGSQTVAEAIGWRALGM